MRIRLFIAASAILLAAGSQLKAEEPEFRNEISVSYGRVNFMDVVHVASGVLASIFSAGYSSFDNSYSLGSFNGEYFRALNNTFSVGGAFSFFGGGADRVDKDTREKTGEVMYRGVSLMPSVKAFWFRKAHWAMYSKLGAGMMLLNDYDVEGDNSMEPNFAVQLSPVCVEAGGKQWRGFFEAGGGMEGFVAAGVRYSF